MRAFSTRVKEMEERTSRNASFETVGVVDSALAMLLTAAVNCAVTRLFTTGTLNRAAGSWDCRPGREPLTVISGIS